MIFDVSWDTMWTLIIHSRSHAPAKAGKHGTPKTSRWRRCHPPLEGRASLFSSGGCVVTIRLRPQLGIRELELRWLPATFTVSNLADSGVGSLRQGILDANASPGNDTVQLAAALTGTLSLSTGEITITGPLVINAVSKFQVSVSSDNSSRIFVANADVGINGVFMTSANAVGAVSPGFGGAILSTANLTLVDCGFQSNSGTRGGAIYHTGSTLSISRSVFAGSFATQGASIWATGTVNLQLCRFDSNRTNNSNSGGGGVWLNSGSLTIDTCTFRGNGSNNSAFGKGGAVYANGTFFAQNTTFFENGAHDGGALYLTSGGTLWNCTVGDNLAHGGGSGGGIHGTGVILESTIVSTNAGGAGPDIVGSASAKYCAIGSASGLTLTDQGNNLAFGLDLKMSTTTDSGGDYTSTASLHFTSPCKNAGSNPGAAIQDGRGPGYVRVFGSAADIGAYEVQALPTLSIQINNGAAQRSRTTRVAITINGDALPSTFPTSWQMKRVPDNAAVTWALDGPTLFQAASTTFYLKFTGGAVENGSLADGVYQLTVFAPPMLDSAGQPLDGNGDGIGGDDYVSPTTPGDPNRIFRLFGDVDGDADVDAADFIQFRLSFGGSNFAFDFDGAVAAGDFIQFRVRFGSMI